MAKSIHTTIEIEAPPEEVWDVLVDFPEHARWNPLFASMTGEPVVGETLENAMRKEDGSAGLVFRPVVLDADPGRLLRWKGRLVLPGLFDGTHEFRIEPTESGCRLIHAEQFSGILVPLMGKVLRDTEAGFVAFNDALVEEVRRRSARNVGC